MINNIFSIFDPSNHFIFHWTIPSMIIVIIMSWNSKLFSTYSFIKIIISTEIKILTKGNLNTHMYISLFLSIFLINLISIIPTIPILSTQINFIIPLSLSIWLSYMIFYIYNFTNKFLAHLTPLGSPIIIIPILILIEVIRNIIRPLTISIRIIANIIAGHLLLHLLTSFSIHLISYHTIFSFILLIRIVLRSIEIIVTLIQRYIFTSLIAIYSNED